MYSNTVDDDSLIFWSKLSTFLILVYYTDLIHIYDVAGFAFPRDILSHA